MAANMTVIIGFTLPLALAASLALAPLDARASDLPSHASPEEKCHRLIDAATAPIDPGKLSEEALTPLLSAVEEAERFCDERRDTEARVVIDRIVTTARSSAHR
jgi:hypothetical protein